MENGECLDWTKDVKKEMEFCGDVIDYPICAPIYRGHFTDEWANTTLYHRDQLVKYLFEQEWNLRKTYETNPPEG